MSPQKSDRLLVLNAISWQDISLPPMAELGGFRSFLEICENGMSPAWYFSERDPI
jgi:hypothetical protein